MMRLAPWLLMLLVGTAYTAREDELLPPDRVPQTRRSFPSFTPTPGAADAALEVVPPEKAFTLEATALDAKTVDVRFGIADCCYLYRDKTRFSLSTLAGEPLDGGPRLGIVDLPPGELATDEYFGRTEIYRGGVTIRLPLLDTPATTGFALNVSYQGCAEKGVSICYEPIRRRFPVYSDGGRLTIGSPQVVEANGMPK